MLSLLTQPRSLADRILDVSKLPLRLRHSASGNRPGFGATAPCPEHGAPK